MEALVLGRLRMRRNGREVAVPGGRVGALLQLFLLRPGRRYGSEELIERLWGESPAGPAGRRRLRVTVSRLRQHLAGGPGTEGGGPGALRIESTGNGYRLVAPPEALDRVRFEQAAKELEGQGPVLDRVLAEWTGTPYQGFDWPDLVRVERVRLVSARQALLAIQQGGQLGAAGDKVRPPTVTPAHIDRGDLLGLLPAAGAGKVAVIVAPPGYGKSSLLAQWAASQPAAAWMALDAEEADPQRLRALLHRSVVAAGLVREDQLTTNRGPTPLDGLVLDDRPAVLVMDGIHHIEAADAVEELAAALRTLVGRGVTVALASRLPLPAALEPPDELRGATLGADDLRFTLEEVASLFPAVSPSQQLETHHEVNGWPIGVVSRLGPDRSGGDDPGEARSLVSFIREEVLAPLEDPLARLLLEIAPLDQFSASLVREVTGRADAVELLGQLRRRGLVAEASPAVDDCYHLHPGMAAGLRRLASGQVDADRVFRRAARWYESRGLKAEAFRCAVAGRERSVAAAVAGDVVLDAALRGEYMACVNMLLEIDPADAAVNYRTHSICCCVALLWLPQPEQVRWISSRLRHFGDDDVLVLLDGSRRASRGGRGKQAVALAERLVAQTAGPLDDSVSDLAPVFAALASAELVTARVAHGDIRHDDPLFARAISEVRSFLPLVAAWIYSDWSLIALLDGEEALARSLSEEFQQLRRSVPLDGVPAERGLVRTLLAAIDTEDPSRLRRLVKRLELDMEALTQVGDWARLALVRLAAAHLSRRAGDLEGAARFEGLAESVILTMEDTALVERFRTSLNLDANPEAAPTSALVRTLTPRQRSVLPHLVSGCPLDEIADQLHISVHTLRGHLRAVYARLGVTSRAAAMARLAAIDLAAVLDQPPSATDPPKP